MLRLPALDLCFWHPVGPHAGEDLNAIVERKRKEISRHGYTLWSFAPARRERVEAWRAQLRDYGQRECLAVCCGDATRDPMRDQGAVHWASEASEDLDTWSSLPSRNMTSYHRAPNRDGIAACAFVVEAIEAPDGLRVGRPASWFRAADEAWASGPVPTRGQYLIRMPRPDQGGRSVKVVLYLRSPFVVWLR